jgi:hypothetical protein
VVQLKDVRNKLQDKFHDIYELASRNAGSLGTELKLPRSVSKQAHWDNVPPQSVGEYYCRSIFIPFNDHIISQVNERY